MGPSEKAFNQVRSILGKLDRNIDQLREQRTHVPAPAPIPMTQPDRLVGGRAAASQAQPAQPARPASAYGRATPLPPTGN